MTVIILARGQGKTDEAGVIRTDYGIWVKGILTARDWFRPHANMQRTLSCELAYQ